MTTVQSALRGFTRLAPLALLALLSTRAHAGDIYEAAVAHAGRPAPDLKRDALDHPADVLRLAAIKPGMKVADLLAGDGYYSELLSYIVGPRGHVLLINNAAFDHWSNNGWEPRIAAKRLPNVEHRTVDLNHMDLPAASLDAIFLVKVYHDLYWVDTTHETPWPQIDTSSVLDQVVRALKPGGTLVIVDHSAQPGTGKTAAGSLHRIDEAYARQDWESHGLKLVGTSDVLRLPDDPRSEISYKGPRAGKTDRFVLVFRKQHS